MMLGMYLTWFLAVGTVSIPLGAVVAPPALLRTGPPRTPAAARARHRPGRPAAPRWTPSSSSPSAVPHHHQRDDHGASTPMPRGIKTAYATQAFVVDHFLLNQARSYAFAMALVLAGAVYVFLPARTSARRCGRPRTSRRPRRPGHRRARHARSGLWDRHRAGGRGRRAARHVLPDRADGRGQLHRPRCSSPWRSADLARSRGVRGRPHHRPRAVAHLARASSSSSRTSACSSPSCSCSISGPRACSASGCAPSTPADRAGGLRGLVPIGAVVLAGLVLSLVLEERYHHRNPTLVLVWATMGLAWNIISGYAGHTSFGHQAFFGVGAYATVLLMVGFRLTPWAGLVAGNAGRRARRRPHRLPDLPPGRDLLRPRHPRLPAHSEDLHGLPGLPGGVDSDGPRLAGGLHAVAQPRAQRPRGPRRAGGDPGLSHWIETSRLALALRALRENEQAAEAAASTRSARR